VVFARKRHVTARELAPILHMSFEPLESSQVVGIEDDAWTETEPSPELERAWQLCRNALKLHPPRDAPPDAQGL
jgi:hypothetical protein